MFPDDMLINKSGGIFDDLYEYESREKWRCSFSSDIKLANEEQKLNIIRKYSEPIGEGFSEADYYERCEFLHYNCAYLRHRLLQWVLIPHGARERPRAIQSVVNMEARHCLIRRAGSDTRPKTVVGFCVSGLYCAKQFRGNHMATDMMLNLLAPFKGHEVNNKTSRFAKIYDEEAHFVPYAGKACFFGLSSSTEYDGIMDKIITPGSCHVKLPLSVDFELNLPPQFDGADTSHVKYLLSLHDVQSALKRYESILRQQLANASDVDRFAVVPEIEVYESLHLATLWFCQKFEIKEPLVLGAETYDPSTDQYSFIVLNFQFAWRLLPTFASHFACADQTKALLRSLQESKQFQWPHFKEMTLTSINGDLAQELGLHSSEEYWHPEWTPRLRLPRSIGEDTEAEGQKVVEWVAMNVIGTPYRA